jgi:hypothetical protein
MFISKEPNLAPLFTAKSGAKARAAFFLDRLTCHNKTTACGTQAKSLQTVLGLNCCFADVKPSGKSRCPT